MVADPASLGPGDLAVRSRLQSLGYAVTVVDDGASTAADAAGKDVVLVSSTSIASKIGTKFRTIAVPIVIWEHALLDDQGMAAQTGRQVNNQTALTINAAGHPLAAGLSGTVTVLATRDQFAQATPNGAAITVASIPGATAPSTFAYEAGAAMPGLIAPARRVALFLSDTTAANWNANGIALFDAAVTWATDAPVGATSVGQDGVTADGGEPGSAPPPDVPVLALALAVILPERVRISRPSAFGRARGSGGTRSAS